MDSKKIQILGSLGNKIYAQNEEPTDPQENALWVDIDAVGATSGNTVDIVIDYNQNDPDAPGYIENRPCYFGPKEEVIELDNVILKIEHEDVVSYPSDVLVEGDIYTLTINGITKEYTAYSESLDGLSFTGIGDSFNGSNMGTITPVYGFCLITILLDEAEGPQYILIASDETGEIITTLYELTDEQISSQSIPVTLTHIKQEIKKLDKRLLPDDINFGGSSNAAIKVVDLDTTEGGVEGVDFSQFSDGDIIMFVGSGAAAGVIS